MITLINLFVDSKVNLKCWWIPQGPLKSVYRLGLIVQACSRCCMNFCSSIFQEFMLCKAEEQDPRKCLREGRAVSRCAFEFFDQLKQNCSESFTAYWTCVDTSEHRLYRFVVLWYHFIRVQKQCLKAVQFP